MTKKSTSKKKKDIVLGVTASIAAYKACDIINNLKKLGFNVIPLMTEDAKNFISPLTLQTLAGNKVIDNMFTPPEQFNPVHTSLAEKADLVLIAPATASIIGKIASGICDDILSCTVISTTAPVLIAPAMNEKMYKNSIVAGNIAKLEGLGYKFIGPIKGHLACGYSGIGHIADVEEIVSEAKKVLK